MQVNNLGCYLRKSYTLHCLHNTRLNMLKRILRFGKSERLLTNKVNRFPIINNITLYVTMIESTVCVK